MGLAVLIFSISKQASKFKDIFISKSFVRYLIAFAAIILISVLTITINGTNDIEFIKYPLSLIFILLAGYFLHFIIRETYGKINSTIVLNYIVAAVLAQVTIAAISFLNPSVSIALQSIQNINDFDAAKLVDTAGYRLNGFGSNFFGAGLINGFALLSIAVLVKQSNNSSRHILYLSFAFIAILGLGSMMARTTLVGGAMSLFFLLIPVSVINKRIVKIRAKFFAYIVLLPVSVILFMVTVFPDFADSLQNVASFGFEMFFSYSETGDLSTASTDLLEEMYVLPDNPKTYIIGDAHFYIRPGDPGNGYYKNTDVGYLRLIYYFGITGTLIYFLLQYGAVINAIESNPGNKTLRMYILLAFVFCLIANLKGFTDFFFLINLFVFSNYQTKDTTVESNIAFTPQIGA